MVDITNLIMNAGSTVVILAYFIYRDIKFMQKLDGTLDVVLKLVEKLDEKEEKKNDN